MYSNSSAPNLDKEYSPSLNTKRFQEFPKPNEQLIENFIKVTKAETERVRAKYNILENVRYGEDDNQLVDIYYKHNENDSPIFVYIHGGYWQELDKSSAGSFVEPLIERNYRVVVVDYNLCPSVTLEQLMEQTANFFKWLFKYTDRTNASKISLCGHSAGAQLASLLLENLAKTPMDAHWTSSFFLISGLYDLRELWLLESANPNNILSLNELKAVELSPLCWALDPDLADVCRRCKVKVHILVAENDSATFIGQSRKYFEKLEAAGIQIVFKIFSHYDHFDIIEEAACKGSAINRYIIENV